MGLVFVCLLACFILFLSVVCLVVYFPLHLFECRQWDFFSCQSSDSKDFLTDTVELASISFVCTEVKH